MLPPSLPITLCVINYNGERYLETALKAAMAANSAFAEILVVDNASSDRSLEIVRLRFPSVRLLSLSHNAGPAGARNAGLNAASCDFILFQDNDIMLAPDCAALLLSALNEHPRAVAVTPRILYASNPDRIQYEGADCHFLGLMTLRNANRHVRDCPPKLSLTTSLVTACFLTDRQRWGPHAPFDEDFEFNYEDHDFGIRAKVCGHDLIALPQATAWHGEGTPGLSYRPGQQYPRRRVYYLIRNRWLAISKSYALKTIVILAPLLVVYEIFQLAAVIKKGWFSEWWAALRWTVYHFPKLMEKRRFVQAQRKISDCLILREGPLPFTRAVATSGAEKIGKAILDACANGYWRLVKKLV
jgi:GT2 family glycosyltransferase